MTSSSGVASKMHGARAPSGSELSRVQPEAGASVAYGGGGWATAARDGGELPSPATMAPGKARAGPAAPSGSGADAAAVQAAAAEAEAAAGCERVPLGRAAATMAAAGSADTAAAAATGAHAPAVAAGIASANASVSKAGPSPRTSHISTHDAPAFEAVSASHLAAARASGGPAAIAAATAFGRRTAGAGGTGAAASVGGHRSSTGAGTPAHRLLPHVTAAAPAVILSLPLAPCSPARLQADTQGTQLDSQPRDPGAWSLGGMEAGTGSAAGAAAAAAGKQPPSTGGGMLAVRGGAGGGGSGSRVRSLQQPRKAASLLLGPSSILRTVSRAARRTPSGPGANHEYASLPRLCACMHSMLPCD